MQPGPVNLITDVAGLAVGQVEDLRLASGTTVVVFDRPAVAAVDVRGGGPGTRETDLLLPERTVSAIDAIALSGGSAFGLDAGAGVMAALAEAGRGFAVGPARVPIVVGAVLFDLINGGDKAWGRYPPYRDFGFAAAQAVTADVRLGTVGAGTGGTTANLKGGIGSASLVLDDGTTVGALAAVNAAGRATIGDGPHFWAAPFEIGAEFGGRGLPATLPTDTLAMPTWPMAGESTTLALVATDAVLTKAQTRQLAVMAQDGMARALVPVHTPLDGDIVFAAATGGRPLGDPIRGLSMLGHAAAICLARASARGVFEARALPFADARPDWKSRFG